ncbi:hypothetical protein A6F65_00937 [Paraurantiacibacter namhicola]|uniref:Uncharacterized protein n=2 Tax=Paraurantiacibacter namhicola TaxID=645517 RepID=A0A1C7D726_9SPHN|nr:hypothetical protein A6F65_00937 [Paraurantiacibacter namhicola]
MDRDEARSALDVARDTDRKMAQRLTWPLWRHALAGGLQALFVITFATPMPFAALLMAVALLGIFWIGANDRKRFGMFVSGWASEAARPSILAAIAITLAGFGAIMAVGEGINRWTPWAIPIALAVFVGVTLASLWWQKLYTQELTEGPAR